MSKIDKVKEFHKVFNVNIEDEPIIPDESRCELRQDILEEEVEELKEAIKNGDLVEVLDALVDIEYVVLGSVLEFGLQDVFDDAFDEVHRSNMTKADDNGEPILRDDGKVVKSDNYEKPNLEQFV